eukprot:TRINITY_DN28224_c0_g1_i1.p1 TRINITY_DN28224_c0_g1~~TRINITY_DN28224_c0_g1_i1.p1  ORF type:complete len:335 (-),score=49.03 TRINITY_DN28224_c0_g1_i1:273-1277(-)
MATQGGNAAATNDLMGVFFMVLSEVLLAGVNSIVKFVPDWSPQQMMVVRYSIDFLLCGSTAALCGYELPGGRRVGLLLFRGLAYVSFIALLWSAIRSCLPLGDVVVIVIASSPIFLVASARLWLKEEIPAIWPLQVLICLVGATMVNKPMAVEADCPASTGLLPVGAGFAGAMMNLLSRSLKDLPPVTLCLFNDIVAIAFGVMWTLLVTPDKSPFPVSEDLSTVLVIGSALIGWVGVLSNVKGYQSVSVSTVASIAGYISVPINYIVQVFMFGEVPDKWSTLGASLICGINICATLQKWAAMTAGTGSGGGDYSKLQETGEDSQHVNLKMLEGA